MHQRTRKAISVAASAAALTLTSSLVRATDYTWLPLAGGLHDWAVPANWNPAGPPSTSGDTANLSVAMAGSQTINLNAPFTVRALTLGSTGAAVTTNIGSGGAGNLIFEDGGGTATLVSAGVAGAVNRLSVPVQLNSVLNIDPSSTNPVEFSGGITNAGGNRILSNLSTSLVEPLPPDQPL